MKIFELYKTTSITKRGLGILDHSPDLSEEEIEEISRIIDYELSFPLENYSKEYIEQTLPNNFAYYKLNSSPNRTIIFLSNYTGMANHTPNRPGNFFSHVVVFQDPKLQLNFSLRHFLKSFEWKRYLDIEEDRNYKPHLGTKEINYKYNDNDFIEDFNYYKQFLNKKNNLSIFSKIIDYIFTFKILEKGQNITLIAEKDELLDWTLSVHYFLPKDLSEKLSFASYVNNPGNYPFKITGVLPQSYTPTNKEYFYIINTRETNEYFPKHPYTDIIFDFIKEGDNNKWLTFVKQVKQTPYNRIEDFVNSIKFLGSINTETLENYKEKIAHLSDEDKKPIWEKAYNEKLDLYHKIILFEIKEKLKNITDYNKLKEYITQFYIDNFEIKLEYRELYFDEIIETVLNKIKETDIPKDESYELFLLNNVDCKTNTNKQLLYLLSIYNKKLNNFLETEKDIDEEIEIVDELDKQYKLNDLINKIEYQDLDIPENRIEINNILKVMKIRDMIKIAKEGKLISELKKYDNFIRELSDKEKKKLFIIAFNNNKYFLKKMFKNFQDYIKIIKTYLPEKQSDFWKVFFDKNNKFNRGNNPEYHSLIYLKKKFVSEIFLHEENTDILDELDFSDNCFAECIKEMIIESTNRNIVIENVNNYFDNKKKRRWF